MKPLTVFIYFILWLSATVATVAGLLEQTPSILYSFDPTKLDALMENSEQQVLVGCNRSTVLDSVTLKVVSIDPRIAEVSRNSVMSFHCDTLSSSNMSQFSVTGRFLGHTVIHVETLNATPQATGDVQMSPLTMSNDSFPVIDYHVSVVRRVRFIDHLFIGLVSFMVICANIGMGCKIDLAVVKEVLTKPIAPAIGFSCQYIIMPLVCVLYFTFFPHVILC